MDGIEEARRVLVREGAGPGRNCSKMIFNWFANPPFLSHLPLTWCF